MIMNCNSKEYSFLDLYHSTVAGFLNTQKTQYIEIIDNLKEFNFTPFLGLLG
jgi:hypothetical protein